MFTLTVKGCGTPTIIPSLVVEHLLSSSLVDEIASTSPLEVLEVIQRFAPKAVVVEVVKGLQLLHELQNSLVFHLVMLLRNHQHNFSSYCPGKHRTYLQRPRCLLKHIQGLAAHRGGFMESSPPEEGSSPLLWRPSDFLKWAELCKSEAQMGHTLMHIVLSAHDVPNICEVELLFIFQH